MAAATPSSPTSTTSTTSTSTLVSDSQNSRMDDQQFITTFFCRAKYDYQSADDASLSFRRGDIIEVLTRLETGWWDGLLGEERGWFPSNYVDVITDEEADIGLAAWELQQQQQQQQANVQLMPTYPLSSSQSTSAQPSASRSSVAQSRLHNDHRAWPDADTDPSTRNGHSVDGPPIASVEGESLPSDYWVPRVTPDGQVSPLCLPGFICSLMNLASRRYTTSTLRPVNAPETFPLTPMATSRMSISAGCGRKSPWTHMVQLMALGTTELLVSVFRNAREHQSPGYGGLLTMACRTSIRTSSTVPFNGPFRRRIRLHIRMVIHPQPEPTLRTILLWQSTNDATHDSSPTLPLCD
jgi:SH3 domain